MLTITNLGHITVEDLLNLKIEKSGKFEPFFSASFLRSTILVDKKVDVSDIQTDIAQIIRWCHRGDINIADINDTTKGGLYAQILTALGYKPTSHLGLFIRPDVETETAQTETTETELETAEAAN